MWVAACPRCGAAVRWNPRGAREPIRVWARLRALNLRLGVALSSGQAAGIASLGIGGLLVEEYRTVIGAAGVTPMARDESLLLYAMLAGAAAFLAAVSAVAFAPGRSLSARVLLAWLVGALPVVLPISLVPLAADEQQRARVAGAFLAPGFGWRAFVLCAAVPLASALLAVPLAWLWRAAHEAVLRHHRRSMRATLAPTGTTAA